jgi:hypothetical protein
MSSYSKIKNCDLYFNWEIVHDGGKYFWENEGEIMTWNKVRYEDYKFENFIEYYTLPKNLIINKTPKYFISFDSYLGGVYSPFNFHETFLKNDLDINEFIEVFFNTIKEFTPTEKLLSLVNKIEIPTLSVHLRREDKIRDFTDDGSINKKDLENLDNITTDFIYNFLKKNKNSKIYFSSDSPSIKEKYNNLFSENIINFQNKNENFFDTYIDIYLLSVSENILMSQIHSNFSIFPSLINKSKLFYFYSRCPIIDYGYHNLNFFYKI